ncbi:porphobilinogen deaminase [Desulfoluna limicola]|uniref:Porphobilinogen deaminase n=1 Tax=Desulfoluna limicola TaxID=2810562 RepID=A0ABM7PID4_9BACT|nr:hydroxymethylbilane synthase [Desulfoluna limicola]BCS97003.1 porphobilinogen deaminase [Desulfoluna limicola]
MHILKIGSRKSDLATWQARTVSESLKKQGINSEIVQIETRGDRIQNTPIAAIGGRGVFTEAIEKQLLNGGIDIAVHSAKDMPSQIDEKFTLIAFTKREKSHDVIISNNTNLNIENKEHKITIGTSSVRRIAMLNHYYPHTHTVEMRGNLQTRVKKMEAGQCDALMLAYAGVKRMGYDSLVVHTFPEDRFTPAVGQGALAIEAPATMDEDLKQRIRACLNHDETESLLLTERAFLRELQGGCSIPVFALAQAIDGDTLRLTGGLISLDGTQVIRRTDTAPTCDGVHLGRSLGRYILDNKGSELLHEIRTIQSKQQNTA